MKGNYLASGGEETTIRIWNLSDYSCAMMLSEHTSSVNCLVHLGDDAFASASRDESIKILMRNDKTSRQTLDTQGDVVKRMAVVSSDLIASGDIDGVIRLWSCEDNALLETFVAHFDLIS